MGLISRQVAKEHFHRRLTETALNNIELSDVYEDIADNRIDVWFDELPTIEPEPKWISCSERLPEDGTEVFIYLFDRPSPYIAWIEDTHWYTEDFEVDREDEPIAWMPLPEPYKEEL